MTDTYFIEGILVAGRAGELRLIVDRLVLDLVEDDVLGADELPPPPDLRGETARLVRLELARGARLVRLSSSDPYQTVIWKRSQLFAMRTRRDEKYWRAGDE